MSVICKSLLTVEEVSTRVLALADKVGRGLYENATAIPSPGASPIGKRRRKEMRAAASRL